MRVILCGLVCALLAGCGGGGDNEEPRAATKPIPGAPRPAESGKDAVIRIAAAVRARDCSSPEEVFHAREVTPQLCERYISEIEPASPPDVEVFGSAAVVKNANGGSTILALDHTGRYKVVNFFRDPAPAPKRPVAKPVDSMGAVTSAIRRDNCEDIVFWSLTLGLSDKQFCAIRPVRELNAALDRDYDARPALLGGDGSFVFYGVATEQHRYFTLVFVAIDDRYLFSMSLEA